MDAALETELLVRYEALASSGSLSIPAISALRYKLNYQPTHTRSNSIHWQSGWAQGAYEWDALGGGGIEMYGNRGCKKRNYRPIISRQVITQGAATTVQLDLFGQA